MIKKLVLLAFVMLNVLLCLALTGMIILSEAHPLQPGIALYGVQDAAEQWRLRLGDDHSNRAELALELAERRLADLATSQQTERIGAAATAFDQALNEAARRIDAVPGIQEDKFMAELAALLDRAGPVVAALEPEEGAPVIIALGQKIEAMGAARTSQDMIALVPPKNTLLETIVVPFLNEDVDHDIYALTGKHADVECEACHPLGLYADTPTGCSDCHEQPVDYQYPNHFEGNCQDCHDADDWRPSEFDHEDITDCQSCHQVDNPPDHYARPDSYWSVLLQLPEDFVYVQNPALPRVSKLDGCAACHPSTTDWNECTFDHGGFSDCEACHLEGDTPEDHYEGLCASCHLTTDWELIEYDHEDVAECRSCHLEDSPFDHYVQLDNTLWYTVWKPDHLVGESLASLAANQYPETCVNCHPNAEDWTDAPFDHTGFSDCASCHLAHDTPDDHYAGQCSNCHVDTNWEEIVFDHTGLPDCQECHGLAETLGSVVSLQPAEEHDPGQCSICHRTDNWRVILFDHTGYKACGNCHDDETPDGHYAGACLNCHGNDDWQDAVFDHTGYAACDDCHDDERPGGHRSGACSSCHNSDNWLEITFDHTGVADCRDCHTAPEHYRGQCSNCHNSLDWLQAAFSHQDYRHCSDCHGQEAPADHTLDRCSDCHSTGDWSALDVDHNSLLDCERCHKPEPGHYPAPCTACHNTNSWPDAVLDHNSLADCELCHKPPSWHFPDACETCHETDDWHKADHSDLADCESCHTAPADHLPGQCSECHDTSAWGYNDYVHDLTSECTSCHTPPNGHYPGQCLDCHCTCTWGDPHFDHTDVTECTSCHPAPSGHWPGDCSDCHNPSDWGDYVFNHTGYTQCTSCHSQDRPANHPRGQCSKCHTTDSWQIATPTPTDVPLSESSDDRSKKRRLPDNSESPSKRLPPTLDDSPPTPAPVDIPSPSEPPTTSMGTPLPLPPPPPVQTPIPEPPTATPSPDAGAGTPLSTAGTVMS